MPDGAPIDSHKFPDRILRPENWFAWAVCEQVFDRPTLQTEADEVATRHGGPSLKHLLPVGPSLWTTLRRNSAMSIKGKAKETAGYTKEELKGHGKSLDSKAKVQEGRDLRNEGRVEDGKAPTTTEPGNGHDARGMSVVACLSRIG